MPFSRRSKQARSPGRPVPCGFGSLRNGRPGGRSLRGRSRRFESGGCWCVASKGCVHKERKAGTGFLYILRKVFSIYPKIRKSQRHAVVTCTGEEIFWAVARHRIWPSGSGPFIAALWRFFQSFALTN